MNIIVIDVDSVNFFIIVGQQPLDRYDGWSQYIQFSLANIMTTCNNSTTRTTQKEQGGK